jgi:glycosyltransferase involved in cell wall biosynthesis
VSRLRLLALEPFHGGSHRAFLDGWTSGSRHDWAVLGLPPRAWKWRMRHAAVTFAERAARRVEEGERWAGLLATSLLDLAAFRGLAPDQAARLPAILYFHENQLTYPVRREEERDLHFAYTHFTACLAAQAVWFNSAYHRDAFLAALDAWLARMPDFSHRERLTEIRARCEVHPPGVDVLERGEPPPPGRPLTILWAARWEHDKNPEDFFAALASLRESGRRFRLHVVGERFRECPDVFDQAASTFREEIVTWGHVASREDYEAVLRDADVVVSTARQENLGLAVIEAVLAGCYPLLPDRLAYPEVVGEWTGHLYDGTPEGLAARLADLAERLDRGEALPSAGELRHDLVRRYGWPALRPRLDAAVEAVLRGRG